MNRHLRLARRRLVLAYVGVFAIVLAAFATAVSWTVTRNLQQQLDQSLGSVVESITGAVRREGDPGPATFRAALGGLRIPNREVFVADETGNVVFPADAPGWVSEAATAALESGAMFGTVEFEDHDLRFYAEPQSAGSNGASWVAVAAADFVEVEDRYPALFGGFGVAALLAMLLVGLGGSILARRSIGEAEVAFERLRRFTADAAHELGTPVSVIRGQADVALQRSRSSEEYADALEGISGEASRLASTVEKLLQLAQADAGEWPTEFADVFLDDLLSELSRSITSLASQQEVNVEIDVSEECLVRGDASLLRQLIMILADNAIQFSPAGGLVGLSAVRDAEGSLLVVTDEGPGIPPELAERVFDRFFRGDPARSRGGAGLGLSIARWVADMHGATVTLVSRESGGTEARVRFPKDSLAHGPA